MWTHTSETPAAFTVALCDYPSLPDAERQRAEARYTRTLLRQLGDADCVAQALRTVESLEDTPPEELSADTIATYQRWVKAAQAAAQAGMQGLGGEEGCYFEVRTAH